VTIETITIDPPMARWPALLRERPRGDALGRSLDQWREITRRELALPVDRPIIATGHQPTLWHPGILAKYMAVSACAERHGLAMANVVVDQDVADINGFDVPMRYSDGALGSRRIELRREQPPRDLPLGWQPAFDPLPLPERPHAASESAEAGARLIHQRLSAHAHAASAAEQVAASFDDLMSPWTSARPMPRIMASSLMNTTLARAMLRAMADDPQRCAETYNRAAASVPEARLTALMIRADYVELPLWRLRDDGTAGRMRAYDNDVESAISDKPQSSIGNRESSIPPPTLLPRALFMTALIRLGVCDLFIHGTGGALYDRAMERWLRDWLGVEAAPMAVVSVTLRLPLMSRAELAKARPESVRNLQRAARDAWHDPDWLNDHRRPSAAKRALLARIGAAPRNSLERHAAFRDLHRHLAEERAKPAVVELSARAEHAMRLARDAEVARRRDWAFPLYPREMLDALRESMVAMTLGSHSPPPLAA
jgi:hypothetical protein